MKVFAPPSDDVALAAAKREKRELQEHLDSFYEMAGKKKLSGAGLAKVEAEVLPQIEAAERKIRKLSTPPVLHRLAGTDVAGGWPTLPVGTRREIILALAEVRLSPVGKGGRWSPWRLAESRWLTDQVTWGEKWRAAGAVPG
jgi:site-specific DNA recombinase